jgi:hypothetical protein
MRVIMTGWAAGGFKSKCNKLRSIIIIIGFMAKFARNRQMTPFQRIFGLPMLLDSKRRRRKSADRMTFRALAAGDSPGKRPAMKIVMAVGAPVIWQSCQRLSLFMAFFAGQQRMFSLEGIPRFAVIEFRTVYVSPA